MLEWEIVALYLEEKVQMKASCPLLDRSICMGLDTAENGWEL